MSNLGDITPGVVWSNIRNNTPGSPVAQHFNSRRATVFLNVRVRGVALSSGTNIQKKQREMKLIFQLGTVQPKGLNFILRAQAYALRSFLCPWQLRITMVSSDWGRVTHPKGLFFFFLIRKFDTFWFFLWNITISAWLNLLSLDTRRHCLLISLFFFFVCFLRKRNLPNYNFHEQRLICMLTLPPPAKSASHPESLKSDVAFWKRAGC